MIEYDKTIFKVVNELFSMPEVLQYLIRNNLHVSNRQLAENNDPFDFCICSISRLRRESKSKEDTDAVYLEGIKDLNKNLTRSLIDGMYEAHIDPEYVSPFPSKGEAK